MGPHICRSKSYHSATSRESLGQLTNSDDLFCDVRVMILQHLILVTLKRPSFDSPSVFSMRRIRSRPPIKTFALKSNTNGTLDGST